MFFWFGVVCFGLADSFIQSDLQIIEKKIIIIGLTHFITNTLLMTWWSFLLISFNFFCRLHQDNIRWHNFQEITIKIAMLLLVIADIVTYFLFFLLGLVITEPRLSWSLFLTPHFLSSLSKAKGNAAAVHPLRLPSLPFFSPLLPGKALACVTFDWLLVKASCSAVSM